MGGYAKTGILLAGLTALFMVIGYLLGGEGGIIMALMFAVATNLFAFLNADKMMLRIYGAKQVDRSTAPEFYDLVAELARKADLPMPKVYIIDNPQPNAFATGRSPKRAAVAATTGLLNLLSRDETAGVMAHELAHVRNRDTLIMTVTATVAGALGMLANFALFFGGNRNSPIGGIGAILIAILAPMAAMVVQMAISRSREYEADKWGAEICGNPEWLASALEKLEHGAQRIDNGAAENNPATAHLFIINPLHTRKSDSLFSTHPNTANRVQKLREMAGRHRTGAVPSTRNRQTRGPWG